MQFFWERTKMKSIVCYVSMINCWKVSYAFPDYKSDFRAKHWKNTKMYYSSCSLVHYNFKRFECKCFYNILYTRLKSLCLLTSIKSRKSGSDQKLMDYLVRVCEGINANSFIFAAKYEQQCTTECQITV